VEALNSPEGDTIEVLLGSMRARLPVHQLDRPAQPKTGPAVSVRYSRPQRTTVERELVLRGMRVEEASARVDGFLDDATLAGLSTVRILHGAGSGALRSAIRELLVGHPLVKSFGPDQELRTDSITVIELN
jgi:DNA mismatch repair protein MutS2